MDDDIVYMRSAHVGPLSTALKSIHQDAIRLEIENPDRGGVMWIGHRAFDKMRAALEEHLDKVDKGGNRSNQISWIKHLQTKSWIGAMTLETWFSHLEPTSKVAKSISARAVRAITLLCDNINSCEALIAKMADFWKTKLEHRASP